VPTGYALLVPMQRPSKEAAASLEDAVFTTVPVNRTFYHTVHRGDSLGAIAARYGVTMEDMRRWNRLKGDGVRVGQKLRVTDAAPAHAAPAAHRVRAAKAKAVTKKRGRAGVVAVRRESGGGGRRDARGAADTMPSARAH
jgi:LysM repeat protein